MSIKIGDTIPNATLGEFVTGDSPKQHEVADLVKGKRIVLFAVPGAFTPACTERHLPGYIEAAEAFKAKGIDEIWCVAVNDVFVLEAWSRDRQVNGVLRLLADGSADWMNKLGLVLDLSDKGLGLRAQRFSAYLDDGVVKELFVDEGGALEKSDAQTLLARI